ncbi:MAG: alanine racemase [Vitreoscilla sp.]|nr:alanine racemase [Burkholderiales bacterium]MBP6339396.1 alanine racemase [Vitreoscilla sp.]MBP6675244.1 alanine racemase [Vitreoscilla sp.]
MLDPWLNAGLKGYPHGAPPLRRSQVGVQGWNVLAGDLPLPLAVLRQGPLQHNLGWMQRLVAAQGIALAPHGKTTMSPQLFQQQLAAGAWGITFANLQQLAVGLASGVRRAVIANQVLQAQDLRHLADLQSRHADLQVMFLLDSAEQLALIEAEALPRALDVLLELGLDGGRTGCRTHDAALALARRAHASAAVRLAGIECYEGLWGTGDSAADARMALGLMLRVQALAAACDAEGLFDTDEVIVTAGGSALFDLVAPALKPELSKPVQGLLRSGCYLTHDDGFYRRMVHVANARMACSDGEGLRAALQVWCVVQSLPEAGLAILGCGKRDVSFDMGLPVPLLHCPLDSATPVAVPEGWNISALNDQHAYLRTGDAACSLQVGDRIALGISHPCTTFDKWRWMPVVDEACNVVDAITTHF